jgi:hypothetical protein
MGMAFARGKLSAADSFMPAQISVLTEQNPPLDVAGGAILNGGRCSVSAENRQKLNAPIDGIMQLV